MTKINVELCIFVFVYDWNYSATLIWQVTEFNYSRRGVTVSSCHISMFNCISIFYISWIGQKCLQFIFYTHAEIFLMTYM